MRSAKFSKIVIFSVCVLLVFAVAAALFFNGASIPANNENAIVGGGADEAAGASYPVSADGYTHGSNVKNNTTAQPVNTASGLISAIQNNTTIRLTGLITLSADDVKKIWNYTYSGTIYGNGQTIEATFPSSENASSVDPSSHVSAYGGLCGKLTGNIYDLTYVHTGGQLNVRMSGNNSGFAGGLVGSVDGGTIENVRLELSYDDGGRVGFVKTSSGSGLGSTNYYVAAGALAGRISAGNIKNVTIVNNAWIEAGVTNGTTNVSTRAPGHVGNVAGIIGPVQDDIVTTGSIDIDNVIVEGYDSRSPKMYGDYVANIGTVTTSSLEITVTNFYNGYKNLYDGNASTPTFLKEGTSPTLAITNMYNAKEVTSGTRNDCNISSSITVDPSNATSGYSTGYTVGFDPKADSVENSLVVYKSGITSGQDYTATIKAANNTTYSDNYAFNEAGNTVIFRNLPTAISNWGGNGGTFNCTINITLNEIEVTPVPDVNKWESSYTTTTSSTGTAVDNGSKLTTAIKNNQNIYLTDDIKDFNGFSHTGTYSGTLDGNGHTIYIVRGADNSTQTVGGLFGNFTGTIKNVRIVLYSSYNRNVTAGERGTGIVAGVINGGTVDNIYVYIPENVTFGVTGNEEGYVGAIAGVAGVSANGKVDGANYTIKNTTVNVDGKMHLDGSYVYLAGFVGKTSTGASAVTAEITNCVFKGNGSFSSSSSESTEPIYLGGTTVLFQKDEGNPQSTIKINGFINAFKGGETNLTGEYSMYGVLSKNDNGNHMEKWTWNVSNVYDYNSPWGDINKKNTGNDYIDISNYRSTVSTTVDGSSIKVTPYFPAGDTTNLVLVAGDGSQSVPDLAYGDYKSTTDGNYKVVTVPKSAISAGSTVTLAEPVTPATPIADMNKWENGYTTESSTTGTAVSDGAELKAAIKDGGDIYLTDDILDFVGFSHTSTYGGTLNGNGHTIYIVKASAASGNNIGGLFSTLTGTIKNVRIVVMDGVDLSGTNYVGGIAGALSAGATVSNVNVIINQGVDLIATSSGNNSGGAGGIAGAVINGATTVTINNSTVELNGSLESNAKWTFIGGFVGHLNGGTVNFRDITFKGNGALNGTASGGEGVHTAGAAIIGGGVEVVSLDGMINGFTGTKTANKSAYAITFVRNGSTSATPTFANIYTYGGDFSNEGGMTYGTPVDISSAKSQISATVADTAIPVKAYFPVTNSGELVLVAGDGMSECPFVTYESYEGVQDGKYMVVSIPKTEIAAHSNVQLTQGKSPVNEPTLATTEEELVYKGGEITVAINQLMSGTTALGEGDYTVVITANGGNALVQNGKPVNAGEYTLTVTLLNGYEFEGGTTEKTIPFTVTPFVISGSLAVNGSAVYDKTEKTVIFTADENKGLFNGDNVVISYNDGDRVNVTEAGFTATAKVPNGNYTFKGGNEISAEFTITAKELTVVWGETSFTYDRSEKAPTAKITEGVIDGDSVTLAVSGAQTAAGQDYTATAAILPENANYTLTNNTIAFSIAKAQVSVSGANATAEYRAAEYTKEEIKAAVFADGMPDVATTTITVSSASVINAGDSAMVTVSLIDGDNYEFEAGAITQFTFTVTAKEISLPAESANKSVVYSPSATYTAAKITELIFGTASIDNVTVKVMNGDVEISGETKVSGAGVYTVTATANKNYAFVDGTTTEYTFEITKAQITLGVSVADWIYGNQASAPVITGNDGNGTVTYLYTGTEYSDAVAPTNAGTYSLEITVAETANYQGGKASCEFTIEKATVTVPTIEDKVYTGEPLIADITDTEEYEVVENSGGTDVATYDVVIRLIDADNYKWSDGTQTADITLEFHIVASGNSWNKEPSIVGWTYGNYSAEKNAPVYEAEKGDETAVVEFRLRTGTDADYDTVADLSTLGAGDYYMRVRVPKTEDYGGLSMVVEFTVAKASISISVSINGWTYGDSANLPTVDGNTASGAVTYSYVGTGDTAYEASETAPVNAGTYKVTATVAETANYLGATAEAEFTIAQKAVTATVTAKNAIYDGAEHAATVSFDGKLESDELTAELLYNGNAENPVNAGSYTVTVQSYGGAAVDNYDITTAEREVVLKISPKELNYGDFDVKYEDVNFDGVYDGKPHGVVATVKDGVLIGDDTDTLTVTVLYNGSEEKPVDADIYELSITISGNDNYVMGADDSAELEIYKATVNISGSNATAQYKGRAYTDDEIKNAIFGEGTWEKFVIEISYNNGAALNAGDTATVTVTGYSDENYALDPEMKTKYTFSVTTYKVAAPELSETSFVYNGAEQSVSLTDDTYVAISENVKTDKGDYKAVAALTDKNNYEWTTGGNADVELPWSITAKEITLKAETSVEKNYDGEAYDFGKYVVTGAEGFYARDNVIVTISAGDVYTPGSYVITVTHDANANYNVTVEPTDAKLTINKADLTIAAKNAEIEYTGKVVTFEFEITGGKVGQDDVEIDVVTYKQNGVAVAPQETGTYDVTFTLKGAQAAYYTALATQVEITAQTATAPDGMTDDSIALPTDDDMIYDGEAHVATLNYTATDGNTYGIIYYNGTSYLDEAVNAGEYTVHVYKNTKTNIVEGISKTMTVEKRVLSAGDISVGGLSFTYSGTSNKVTATGSGVNDEDVTLKTLYDGSETAPVNAGTYTVTFVSVDGNYAVEEGISYTMSVARASVSTPVANALTYNAEEQIAFNGDPENRYTVGGVYKATDVSAGGYTATFTLVSDNYKWAALDDEQENTINVDWNITPYGVTIEISGAEKTKVYNGVALTAEELAALFTAPEKLDGGKVEITVTVNGGEVLNVGEYVVTAALDNINYVAESVQTTFTVTKATPEIGVKAQDKLLQEGDKLSTVGIYLEEGSTPGTVVWDDPELTLAKGENIVTWTYTPDDTLNYTGATGRLTLTVGDEVLTAFEKVSDPDKTNYVAFEAFDPTGMVLKATFDNVYEQEVTANECEITFNDDNASVDRLTAKVTQVTLTYGNMSVTVDITVEKLTVEIPTLDKTELEYNAEQQTVSVPEDARYYMVDGNVRTNVGKYNAVIALTDADNYKWSDGTSENKSLVWNITPVTLSVKITLPDNLVYDGTAKVARAELTQGTLYGGAQISLKYELTDGTVLDGAPVNAGVYEVVATLPDNTYRFAAGTEYSVPMTIAKKAVVITTNGDREKYYDGNEVSLAQLADNFTVTDGLKVVVTVSGKVLNAGSYTVTASIDGENSNYTATPVSYTFTVRKGTRTVNATMNVGYKKLSFTAAAGTEDLEYSLDGNVWHEYTGEISVELLAKYTYYVRYAESENYNMTAAEKVEANITKAALAEYVEERFTGDITLADAADIAALEALAAQATGENADFDAKLAELSAERSELVNGATSAIEKALKAGGALRGYAMKVAAVAVALGGVSAVAAIGLCLKTRKGGKKNEKE